MAAAVIAYQYLFHPLTNHTQQNNLNLCHLKNSILRASTRNAAKQSPNPFVPLALKNYKSLAKRFSIMPTTHGARLSFDSLPRTLAPHFITRSRATGSTLFIAATKT